jgi:hypothetical protein
MDEMTVAGTGAYASGNCGGFPSSEDRRCRNKPRRAIPRLFLVSGLKP